MQLNCISEYHKSFKLLILCVNWNCTVNRFFQRKKIIMGVSTFPASISAGKLHRAFSALREFKAVSQEHGRKKQMADEHCHKVTKKKALIAWRSYINLSFRKLVSAMQRYHSLKKFGGCRYKPPLCLCLR